MTDPASVSALQALGFSEIEASIYAFLVAEGAAATGYRIAQATGKATANTYKALATLAAKGAVEIDDAGSRLCRAVPPEELLARLDRGYAERRAQAVDALSRLGAPESDERVYRMHSRAQVLERARQMLGRAREVAVLNAFPGPMAHLREPVAAAAARGVSVLLKVYRPEDVVEGVRTVVSSEYEHLASAFPGEELNVAVDGEEHLLAMLEHGDTGGDGVVQAIWSRSPFLSFAAYNAQFCEWALTSVIRQIGIDSEARRAAIDLAMHPTRTPGFRRLTGGGGGRAHDVEEKA